VYAAKTLREHLRDVRVATVSTGVNLGVTMLGNKGGVGIWMRAYNTPLCFVCAHLSAGAKEGDAAKRSEDYQEIFAKLSFPPPQTASSDGSFEKPANVADAFASVWVGDLNYRLNATDEYVRNALVSSTATNDVDRGSFSDANAPRTRPAVDYSLNSPYAVAKNDFFSRLLRADQLLIERAAGKAFGGWTEAPVAFPPTYKYRPGTHTYSGAGDPEEGGADDASEPAASQKEERKKRTPAWCDRILWRGRDIRQISYGRSELTRSDHKPVFGAFRVFARELSPEKLQAVLQDTRRELDAIEMASQPRCTVENPRAVFERPLFFAEPASTSFRVVNTGDVPASWNFVASVPGESAVTPPWLRVSPLCGHLLPGEETVITATATVVGGGDAGPAALAERAGFGTAFGGTAFGGTESSSRVFVRPSMTTAGSIAEAARLAQARAVSAGIARVESGGGVSVVSPESKRLADQAASASSARGSAADASDLVASGSSSSSRTNSTGDSFMRASASVSNGGAMGIPVDAILVLHLDRGRDFFLTVAGRVAPTVFGKPLHLLPLAAFPPDVPRPVCALVDYLFEFGLETRGLFPVAPRSVSRGVSACRHESSLAGLALVREALDAQRELPSVSGVSAFEAAEALLAVFASLPRPLFASTRACLSAVDGAMAPWAQAAAQCAGTAAATGASWTLATAYLIDALPSASAAEAILANHLRVPERAAIAHAVSFLRALFRSPASGAAEPGAAARIVSQFAEVWFPPPPPAAAAAAATRMGRLAFVGALCGVAPDALDGFNPMATLYDATLGTGGERFPGLSEMERPPPSGTSEMLGMGSVGVSGLGIGGSGFTGNLIDL
jgi:phosphatidylinositol-bisphosphatase